MVGLNLQNNANTTPELSDLDENTSDTNMVLRFANTTFFWIILSFGQYLFNFLIWERYFTEPPAEIFVDFCTLAKVSVIVMDEPFHGYYLHCRSPYQHADGTMMELISMLHKEEAGMTTDRSLIGAPTGIQSFELFLSGEFRANFDKILTKIIGDNQQSSRREMVNSSRGQGGAKVGRLQFLPSEKVLKAWQHMNLFLKEFIENGYGTSGLKRTVREATYQDKLLHIPPDLSIPEQSSVFLTDPEYEYCNVLFLGCEIQLLVLNILAYSTFDLWFGNVAVSILLTYLLELLLVTVRQNWGEVITAFNFHTIARNSLISRRSTLFILQMILSRKTLIDGRFLI